MESFAFSGTETISNAPSAGSKLADFFAGAGGGEAAGALPADPPWHPPEEP